MQLKGKVVFITGGGGGFGQGVGEAVLKRGAKVCLADVNVTLGEKAAAALGAAHGEKNVIFVKCDVTNTENFKDAFQAAVKEFGYVDIMCNNAGIMDERCWEKQTDINFNGVVRGTTLAIEHMTKANGGKGGLIINTASIAALVPSMFFPVYSGTKAAVLHYTSSWASSPAMAANSIRFASICPSGAKTNLLNLADDQIYHLDIFHQAMEMATYCTVEQVVEGFIKAMEDDDVNGSAITITGKEGVVIRKQLLDPALKPLKPVEKAE